MNRIGTSPVCGHSLPTTERLVLAATRITSAPAPIDPNLVSELENALAAYLRDCLPARIARASVCDGLGLLKQAQGRERNP